VVTLKQEGYHPYSYYQNNPLLKDAIDLIASGHFSHGDAGLFQPLLDRLLHHDPFMLLADYQAYVDCQQTVGQAYSDSDNWTRMAILNSVRMGSFSSDRSIAEYCSDIWKVSPFPVGLVDYGELGSGRSGKLMCKLN
jgi:starch phosphorylase